MKKLFISVLIILFIFIMTITVLGSETDSQIVNYEVTAINEIEVSGNPAPLIIDSAVAGSEPAEISDSSTSYDITTNETNKKITGQLAAEIAGGVTLSVELAAPTGAVSAGKVDISNTSTAGAADLVTGISEVAETGNTINYYLDTDITSGIVASDTKSVTLTIIDGS